MLENQYSEPVEDSTSSLRLVTEELRDESLVTLIDFKNLKLTAKLAAGTDGIVYKASWG